MIIARSPLRISIGGGGTDLPSYYRTNGGFVVAAAIDKYVYVSVSRRFTPGLLLKYSKLENQKSIAEIDHPIIRTALKVMEPRDIDLELCSIADIPAGTGLGSSGSFTTSLIKALSTFEHKALSAKEIAELACHIEIDLLGEPIGKQDQYVAAFGGLTSFTFTDQDVRVKALNIDRATLHQLEDNLLLFFTGFSRSASEILSDQKQKTEQSEHSMLSNLDHIKELGFRSASLIESGNLQAYGELLRDHWALKKKRSAGMSNEQIDYWYELGIANGAIGGKLVGAGGGGFLLFMAHDPSSLRKTMKNAGLEEIRFKFDFEGTKVVMSA